MLAWNLLTVLFLTMPVISTLSTLPPYSILWCLLMCPVVCCAVSRVCRQLQGMLHNSITANTEKISGELDLDGKEEVNVDEMRGYLYKVLFQTEGMQGMCGTWGARGT